MNNLLVLNLQQGLVFAQDRQISINGVKAVWDRHTMSIVIRPEYQAEQLQIVEQIKSFYPNLQAGWTVRYSSSFHVDTWDKMLTK